MASLTYKQIAQAITAQLQLQFPNVPVMQEDVKEGSGNASNGYRFLRPSFKVTFDAGKRDERLYNSLRSLTCRIHYFPSDIFNYSLEFLDILDGLETTFALNFVCADRTLTIIDSRHQQVGDASETKFMEFDFDLEWYDDPNQSQSGSTYPIQDLERNFGYE